MFEIHLNRPFKNVLKVNKTSEQKQKSGSNSLFPIKPETYPFWIWNPNQISSSWDTGKFKKVFQLCSESCIINYYLLLLICIIDNFFIFNQFYTIDL